MGAGILAAPLTRLRQIPALTLVTPARLFRVPLSLPYRPALSIPGTASDGEPPANQRSAQSLNPADMSGASRSRIEIRPLVEGCGGEVLEPMEDQRQRREQEESPAG